MSWNQTNFCETDVLMGTLFQEIEEYVLGKQRCEVLEKERCEVLGKQRCERVGDQLNSEQVRFGCGMINLFGSEDYPVANPDNIKDFKADDVVECMREALESSILYEGGVRIAEEIVKKLETDQQYV